MRGRLLLKITIILVLLGSLSLGGLAAWVYGAFTRPGPLENEIAVVIPPGSGVKAIASILVNNGVIDNAHVFEIGTRVMDDAARLRAGEFLFTPAISARGAADILKSGKTVQRRLTVAEGLSSSQVVAQLNATDGLDGHVMVIPPEGSLLPETYYFSYGDSRANIIERMKGDMQAVIGDLWAGRQEGLPLNSPEEAVILASIVEKETGVPEERPRVASVFINRLRKGMRLQSDPTVVYGLTENGEPLGRPLSKADLKQPTAYNTYVIDGDIRARDLRRDDPYNTYRRHGLPPGPIANPGLDAIKAVMHPMTTSDLYFVADGTGGHAFATTLDEHNRNVRRWRKLQAEQNSGS